MGTKVSNSCSLSAKSTGSFVSPSSKNNSQCTPSFTQAQKLPKGFSLDSGHKEHNQKSYLSNPTTPVKSSLKKSPKGSRSLDFSVEAKDAETVENFESEDRFYEIEQEDGQSISSNDFIKGNNLEQKSASFSQSKSDDSFDDVSYEEDSFHSTQNSSLNSTQNGSLNALKSTDNSSLNASVNVSFKSENASLNATQSSENDTQNSLNASLNATQSSEKVSENSAPEKSLNSTRTSVLDDNHSQDSTLFSSSGQSFVESLNSSQNVSDGGESLSTHSDVGDEHRSPMTETDNKENKAGWKEGLDSLTIGRNVRSKLSHIQQDILRNNDRRQREREQKEKRKEKLEQISKRDNKGVFDQKENVNYSQKGQKDRFGFERIEGRSETSHLYAGSVTTNSAKQQVKGNVRKSYV